MNILLLRENPVASKLETWLKNNGDTVYTTAAIVQREFIKERNIDLIISYTYRHIISKDIIEAVQGNIINLHISYLPWNQGANPNQWSWIEDTPKGVTIHYVDEGLDTGDIIAQNLVEMDKTITLRESYDLLNDEIIMLFKKIYNLYPYWNEMRKIVRGEGSYHSIKQFSQYNMLIQGNYDISVEEFCERVKEYNESHI